MCGGRAGGGDGGGGVRQRKLLSLLAASSHPALLALPANDLLEVFLTAFCYKVDDLPCWRHLYLYDLVAYEVIGVCEGPHTRHVGAVL